MKCPFCGFNNIAGEGACDACGEDLTAFDANKPRTRFEKSLAKDELDCLVGSSPVLVAPDTTLGEVAAHLAVDNRSILVMKAGQLLGIVTERDLLFKVMGKISEWRQLPVSDFMTAKPETLEFSDKIAYALHKMAIGGFRHLPLMQAGHPEKVISVRDLLAYLAESFPDAVGIHQNS